MRRKYAIINDQGNVFYLTEDRKFAEFTVGLLNEFGENYRIDDAAYFRSNGKWRRR